MANIIALLLGLIVTFASIAGWATNVVWTFHQHGWDIALGAIGIFVPFIGAVHGIYLWF